MTVERSSTSDTSLSTPPRHEDLLITRTFDAPRELMWNLWTDPKHLAQWWGPQCFTNPVCEIDLRPGGAILIHMRGPEGTMYPMKGEFREIVEPERLVYNTIALEDDQGSIQLEIHNTITFTERDGKTELTVRASVVTSTPEAAGALAGMDAGWNQTLDKLTDYLATA